MIGIDMQAPINLTTNSVAILLISLGSKQARREYIELAITRAASLCSKLTVCLLDTPEIINRKVIYGEDEQSAKNSVQEKVGTMDAVTNFCGRHITLEVCRFSEFEKNPKIGRAHV
jgi:hypothetical protein